MEKAQETIDNKVLTHANKLYESGKKYLREDNFEYANEELRNMILLMGDKWETISTEAKQQVTLFYNGLYKEVYKPEEKTKTVENKLGC